MTDGSRRKMILAAVPRLRAFAISLTGSVDRADDLVQETVLRAWAHSAAVAPHDRALGQDCAIHWSKKWQPIDRITKTIRRRAGTSTRVNRSRFAAWRRGSFGVFPLPALSSSLLRWPTQ